MNTININKVSTPMIRINFLPTFSMLNFTATGICNSASKLIANQTDCSMCTTSWARQKQMTLICKEENKYIWLNKNSLKEQNILTISNKGIKGCCCRCS